MDFERKTVVKCFSDGCDGQNKNIILIAMLEKRLVTDAHEQVNISYGHSFIPPNRVFSLIEKNLKKKDTILQPSEYEEILGRHVTVHK